MTDLTFVAKNAFVEGYSYKEVVVRIVGADPSSVIEALENAYGVDSILSHFNKDTILEYIGIEKCKDYFDLVSNEESAK